MKQSMEDYRIENYKMDDEEIIERALTIKAV